VLEQLQNMQKCLEKLPIDLELLKQQLEQLDRAAYFYNSNCYEKHVAIRDKNLVVFQSDRTITIGQIEPTFYNSIERLEAAMPQLKKLEYKIGNLIVLRERIEALQEQIGIVPVCEYQSELKQVCQKKQISIDRNQKECDKSTFFSKLAQKFAKKSSYLWLFFLTSLSLSLFSWRIASLNYSNPTIDSAIDKNMTHMQSDRDR
jgi:hypothetical protein